MYMYVYLFLYVYVYVCICVYMCVYVCICMYMYVYVCVCMRMYVYVCVCMCVFVYVCVSIYLSIYPSIYSAGRMVRTCGNFPKRSGMKIFAHLSASPEVLSVSPVLFWQGSKCEVPQPFASSPIIPITRLKIYNTICST